MRPVPGVGPVCNAPAMATNFVLGWELDQGTDRRTGRPMETRTPHAVASEDAGGTPPVRAACRSLVDEVTGRAFSTTPTLAAGRPCPACSARVGA